MKRYVLAENELDSLVEELYRDFPQGVVVLQGDLAAGKTSFVKAFAKKRHLSEEVTSPTFSLQQCYGERLFHYDIYNHGLAHFVSLGMLEELDKEGLHFVEWGDDELIEILLQAAIPTVVVQIEKRSDNKREYRIQHAHA